MAPPLDRNGDGGAGRRPEERPDPNVHRRLECTNTDKTSLHPSAVKASALIGGVSAGTAQAVRGGWAYNRSVQSRFFINTFNDCEYDRFQALDLRFVLGAGLGYGVW